MKKYKYNGKFYDSYSEMSDKRYDDQKRARKRKRLEKWYKKKGLKIDFK